MDKIPCTCCKKPLDTFEQLELSDGIFCSVRCHVKWLNRQEIAKCFVCNLPVYDTDPRCKTDNPEGGSKIWIHFDASDESCYLRFFREN